MKPVFSLLLAILMLSATVQYAAFSEEGTKGNCTITFADLSYGYSSSDALQEELTEVDSFVPEDADKAIFGSDDRITVNNTSGWPFRAIAHMQVMGECGDIWSGTGFMVGKNQLLTAAHCLICPEHGKWAFSTVFYFGYKNTKNYHYKYSGDFTAVAGNTFSKGAGYEKQGDFACVVFPSNIGDYTGWFGYRYGMPDQELLSRTVYAAGYRDGLLKYDYGKLSSVDDEYLNYKIDTVAGNSGGPIFIRDDNDEYRAVGIIIAENSQENTGYRLTKTIFDCFGT